MPGGERRGSRVQGSGVADIAGVGLGPAGKRGLERFQQVVAACDQPQDRAARRVVARQRFTDAARGAGEEDLQLALSLRATPIAWSTIWKTRSMLPAPSIVTTYLPLTTTRGTLSTLYA